jgi:flagellar FliJ protein
MKKFRFPLQPVGVLRSHQELRAREVFAAAVHRYVQSEERLSALRQRVAELAEVLFHGRTDRFLAADAAALLRVYRGECNAVMEAEREVIEARDAMATRRQEYIEANRKLKTVQKLEEKARERHRLDGLRSEQGELDELASFRAFRAPVLS